MPKINNKGVKEIRRQQAEERQAIRDNRGTVEQINILDTQRPGDSVREWRRLVGLPIIPKDMMRAHLQEIDAAFAKRQK